MNFDLCIYLSIGTVSFISFQYMVMVFFHHDMNTLIMIVYLLFQRSDNGNKSRSISLLLLSLSLSPFVLLDQYQVQVTFIDYLSLFLSLTYFTILISPLHVESQSLACGQLDTLGFLEPASVCY